MTNPDAGVGGAPLELATDQQHLAALEALKSLAVVHGYQGVEGALLARIYALLGKSEPLADTDRTELDNLVIELSKITYPVNIGNGARAKEGAGVWFVYGVIASGFVAAIVTGMLIWAIRKGVVIELAGTWLTLALGFLGAVVHVMLPNGRLNLFLGVDAANKAASCVRVVMGGLLGFVISLIAAPIGSLSLDSKQLIIPLLGGYSITLVVGMLAKAVAAVQLAFDIDIKSVRASMQK